jgi:hypothetical protein
LSVVSDQFLPLTTDRAFSINSVATERHPGTGN